MTNKFNIEHCKQEDAKKIINGINEYNPKLSCCFKQCVDSTRFYSKR